MKMTIGSQIRKMRAKLKMDRKQLAKKLKLSAGYLGHLERDAHVHLSERIIDNMGGLGIRLTKAMIKRHNERARRWYKAYNKSRAA